MMTELRIQVQVPGGAYPTGADLTKFREEIERRIKSFEAATELDTEHKREEKTPEGTAGAPDLIEILLNLPEDITPWIKYISVLLKGVSNAIELHLKLNKLKEQQDEQKAASAKAIARSKSVQLPSDPKKIEAFTSRLSDQAKDTLS